MDNFHCDEYYLKLIFLNCLKNGEVYHSTCVISGCKIVDILEAAHINPYRGEKEHHTNNGLLLRADIHTLFDLDLIQINPDNYIVEISDKLVGSEYEQYNGLSLNDYKTIISEEALKVKYHSKNKVGIPTFI